MSTMKEYEAVVPYILLEIQRARSLFPPFHSAHEGYATLLEEVDELWELVKANPTRRDYAAMRKEAVQVAAMAISFIVEVCGAQQPSTSLDRHARVLQADSERAQEER